MPVLGSPDCEWLLRLAIFYACSWCLFLTLQIVSGHFAMPYFMLGHDTCSWLSRQWVATLPYHILCLFIMLVLGSPDSEWLLYLAILYACSWCLYLALQKVTGYFALPYFMPTYDACSWLSRQWVATMLSHILCLLIMPVLGSRKWVATLPCHISCLLMMPVLGSPESEWLSCLVISDACSWCQFLTLQRVSGYCALLYFMPAYDACSWLSREWVATMPCHTWCLLMMPILDSPGSEWLLCLAIFYACSWCLFLAFQRVSDYCALLYFMPAHDACSWLQVVSGNCALLYFMPAHDACFWLSREWVLCLAIFYACS